MISLSDAARTQLRKFKQPKEYIRIRIVSKGCTGLAYQLETTNNINNADVVFIVDGISIVVDAFSQPLIQGTAVDYVVNDMHSEFIFENPKAKTKCACGESFTL